MPKTKAPFRSHDPQPFDPAERRRVFTLHVRPPDATRLRGRVIHAASGAVSYFESADELASFVQRVLIEND